MPDAGNPFYKIRRLRTRKEPDVGVGPKSSNSSSDAVRLGRLTVMLFALGVTFGLYVIHAHMPTNAVTLPYEKSLRQPVRQLVPEGWAMFTRSPREDDLIAFVRTTDRQWRNALLAPHSEARNAFGLARRSRTQGVELGVLTGETQPDAWRECRGTVSECLDLAPIKAVSNTAPAPTLCGDVGLIRRPPVPWAWSGSADDITMPGAATRLAVSC